MTANDSKTRQGKNATDEHDSRPNDWETVGQKRLAQSLRDLVMGERAVEPFFRILTAIEEGEEPDVDDLSLARYEIGELKDVLDDVCKAYGVPRWRTGITFGELTEEEFAEYNEATERFATE